jgi:hypothetical protein
MRNLNIEELNYTKETSSFSVFYDCIKDLFLKNNWKKINQKWNTIRYFYNSNKTVLESFKEIKNNLKKNDR